MATCCPCVTLAAARKRCIEQEKQWDFLKDLTAKIPDIAAAKEEQEESATAPRRGRSAIAAVDIEAA